MRVAVVMGSDSDWKVMQGAVNILKEFGVEHRVAIASAHRTPEKLAQFVHDEEAAGATCFIAGAGAAAHLPGVVASLTSRPVIGVPLAASLGGLDALLAIVQMPSGMPVATVAIGGAKTRRCSRSKSARQAMKNSRGNLPIIAKNRPKKWKRKIRNCKLNYNQNGHLLIPPNDGERGS